MSLSNLTLDRVFALVATAVVFAFVGAIFQVSRIDGQRADAYARGVCDQARDSNHLQRGSYDKCVAEVSRTGLDQ